MKGGLAVVLVEPRYPGNVGSVARAMANTGFDRLVLVNPCPLDHPELRQMALGALPIVERAAVVPDLAAALAGSRFSVATSCRPGKLRRESYDPRGLAARLAGLLPDEGAALVFGPEDRGLTNEELALCRAVATVPSDPGFPSLNLSHAVLLFLWEIRAAGARVGRSGPARPRLADAARLEEMYRHLGEALLEIGFLQRANPGRMLRDIRRIFDRAALDEREVRIVRGMLRQFTWYVRSRGGAGEGEP